MKDFKVRIWNAKNKEMIYPSESFLYTVSLDGEVFRGTESSIKDKENCEIMLFTGFKDKNGEDIYEGDILKYQYNKDIKLNVVWLERLGNWSIFVNREDPYFFSGLFSCNKDCEVIGHIYE